VAILNPDHLFEQANRLAVPFGPGSIRQVDVRRAISAAYYGLFHAVLTAAAAAAATDAAVWPNRMMLGVTGTSIASAAPE
jgi:hypothetical protein